MGDPLNAKRKLGWEPKTTMPQLVSEMVRVDYASAERDTLVKRSGFRPCDHFE